MIDLHVGQATLLLKVFTFVINHPPFLRNSDANFKAESAS